jgi:carboxyl-terminal processing protease
LDLKLDKNRALVKTELTAELARQLLGEVYFYQIVLKNDAMVKAVLKK